MQNKVSGFFERIENIVDSNYEGNKSAFCRDAGITPQYYNKMQRQSRGEAEGDPNPSLDVIMNILKHNKDVDPAWLLTGQKSTKKVQQISEEVGQHEQLLDELKKADIKSDERLEFVLNQLKLILSSFGNGS